MFSGHGTMIDGQFYLVPYGADNSTPARLKVSAIPAGEFQSEITKLAQHGRVLVLLDACRSAGLIGALPAAEVLKSALAASNVTVLTSSKADKLSREDEKWGHGAFTKVLLDALSGSVCEWRIGVGAPTTQKSNHRHRRLLRARRERPRRHRAAEQRDEVPPFHSITSSARASSVGGTSRPSAFAVVRLKTR
jgi:uncharacterized caspase-like protein